MNPLVPSASTFAPSPTFACIHCSERKVRCDKQNPCSSCTKYNVQCIFRPPRPSRRRRKLVHYERVDERLKRYEALLQEKGVDPSQISGATKAGDVGGGSSPDGPETVRQMPTPPSTISGQLGSVFKPQLLQGQSGTKLVDNNLWSRVAEEIHDRDSDPEEDSENDTSDGGASDDPFAYILGFKAPVVTSSHPPAAVIHQLWQTFIENVNPLSKLVHVPSLQPAIEKAITNIERIPRGFEALMFAIYSVAVLSLTEDECNERLGESRSRLLPHYVAATKAALSRARFMSSTSIVVLQALVLHILSIRDSSEPRMVWIFTGIVVRNAEAMGMRLDGTLLGLSPFETEVRRRLWWQLKMHDFRAAELAGQSKLRSFDFDETTPKAPANVNDSELYPFMTEAAAELKEPTEMMWCMFRTELANFATSQKAKTAMTSQDLNAVANLDNRDGFIKFTEDMLETKYMRFCDPCQPLHFMTMLGCRIAINLMRFRAHHPRRWATLDHVPVSEQQMIWNIVIHLLEQYNMVQSSPQLRRFAWNVPYFIQWEAVIHILDTLRADPLHTDAMKAWQLVNDLYKNNSENLLGINRPIFVAVGNLCLKAYNVHEAAVREQSGSLPDPPGYITKLRERRDAAKARREAVLVRSKEKNLPESENVSDGGNANISWSDLNLKLENAPVEAQPQQSSVVNHSINPVQGNTRNGDDAFWLNDVLDNDFPAAGAADYDMMNLNADAILAQDSGSGSPEGGVIDWAQWDAWLGNIDPVQSFVATGPG